MLEGKKIAWYAPLMRFVFICKSFPTNISGNQRQLSYYVEVLYVQELLKDK